MAKEKVSITLDKEIIKAVEKYAETEHRNFSDAINYMLATFFKRKSND